MNVTDFGMAPRTDPSYALFLKYLTLDAELKETMRRIVEARKARMNRAMAIGDTALYQAYCTRAQSFNAFMKKRIEAICDDASFDKPEILEFYRDVCAVFETFLPGGFCPAEQAYTQSETDEEQ